MHKLHRGASPGCLNKYRHGRDKWDTVLPDDKLYIWHHLEIMQGQRCAYCEAGISDKNRHIDHFRQKAGHRYPQGTFQWDNLFGSCNRPDNCGKHKDKCGDYDYRDVIKPDIEDPEKFFLFVSDGTIKTRSELNAHDTHRASETLRILNLNANNGSLRHMRKRAVTGYLLAADEIQRIAKAFPQADWQAFLRAEIEATAHLPFATAIKHLLSPDPSV